MDEFPGLYYAHRTARVNDYRILDVHPSIKYMIYMDRSNPEAGRSLSKYQIEATYSKYEIANGELNVKRVEEFVENNIEHKELEFFL